MGEAPTIDWEGKSGKKYRYWIYPIGTTFKDEGGNYAFAKETKPGYWSPQYFGQTKSLKDRLGDHEKEACAKRNGATHIHAHLNANEADRLAEERDLIQKWNPPCNVIHAG
jgi:hypothetical protein